jgi:hypothetical protein
MALGDEPTGIAESKEDDEIDTIARRIISELQTASSKDLADAGYARKILRSSDVNFISELTGKEGGEHSGPDLEIEKKAMVKALILST